MNEIDVMRDISGRFERAGIPYMLTGSLAMNYYAQPRMTRDIDIVVALEPNDVQTVLRSFGTAYYVDAEAVRDSVAHQSMFNVVHLESMIKVDCIVKKTEAYRRAEFERRQQVRISDVSTWIVSREDLIISKLFWAKDSHSERQLADVKNLLAGGYDKSYLEHWTRKLELDTLLKECLNE